jgi:hypothetical protein
MSQVGHLFGARIDYKLDHGASPVRRGKPLVVFYKATRFAEIDGILIPAPFLLQFISQIFPVERHIHPVGVGHVEITVGAFGWTKPDGD